jgi:4-amino-4-deoxy-L-arabinose transferase-like glycosyltransferase
MTVFTAIVPFARAFFRFEIDYNEGWNIYNAATVAAHRWLYPARYGLTSVNYPMLSFWLMAQLHHLTHEYLFTARIVSLLSLLASGILVSAIVRKLSCTWTPALLAGLYCVAIFCANADNYVGMDDPQMLAQAVFLVALYIFVRDRDGWLSIAVSALLFVIAGCIKHSPIDFPLAVLVELLLVSRWRAIWFSVCGLGFMAFALALNVKYGGPHFFDQLLAPRGYSAAKAAIQLRNILGPILLPLCVSLYTAWQLRKDRGKRIAALLLACSMLVGGYFGGGEGVSFNALFTVFIATAILAGLFAAEYSVPHVSRTYRDQSDRAATQLTLATATPLALFLWLFIPMILSGNWQPISKLHAAAASQTRFDKEVAAIAATPGDALCESLLKCHYAGKPYLYDPFNATRLARLGKLDETILIEGIRSRRFGAIQLDVGLDDPAEIDRVDSALTDRFTPQMLAAISANYALTLKDADGAVYLPR